VASRYALTACGVTHKSSWFTISRLAEKIYDTVVFEEEVTNENDEA